MSGQSQYRSPGAATLGRDFTRSLFALLISLFFVMGPSTIVNALVPSGYYPANDPLIRPNGSDIVIKESALPSYSRTPAASDVDFSESIFTFKSDLDVRPGLIWMKQPNYPAEAERAAIEGRVLLHVLVGESGCAKEVRIIEEFPAGAGLGQCCLAAARKAVYSPGVKNSKRVKSWVEIPIVFKRSD